MWLGGAEDSVDGVKTLCLTKVPGGMGACADCMGLDLCNGCHEKLLEGEFVKISAMQATMTSISRSGTLID